MIAKFIPASVALIMAIAGSAAAHDPGYDNRAGHPAGHRADYPPGPAAQPGYGDNAPGYRAEARRAEEREELRHSDLNRDGRVTLAEALQQGRRTFRYSDRDQNRALSPREVSWTEVAREDRDRNGWLSYGEYQDAIRRSFYRFDTNRDGVLARYELRQPNAPHAAGWRR